jgi:tRNA(Ile)-lysidine synthase
VASRGGGPAGPIDASEALDLFRPLAGASLLAAFSGGPDSTALLGLLAEAGPALGLNIAAVTIDHGLRPHSAAEATAASAFATRIGIAHAIRRWEHDGVATGLQEKARAARYRLLSAAAREAGAEAIVTGHTLDDQAETALMRMAAGSGLTGLGGMRPARTLADGLALLRPLLNVPKARLVATCEARGWPFSLDPSNAAERFERARWRAVIPVLSANGIDAATLGRLAARLARADEALEAAAANLLAQCRGADGLDARALLEAPAELGLRALAMALGGDPAAPVPLSKLEALFGRIAAASAARAPLRATLHGSILALDQAGRIRISPEGDRRRGRRPGRD